MKKRVLKGERLNRMNNIVHKDPYRPISIHIDSAMDRGYIVTINKPFLNTYTASIADAIKAINKHLQLREGAVDDNRTD